MLMLVFSEIWGRLALAADSTDLLRPSSDRSFSQGITYGGMAPAISP
ncbi:MAG: hypothetical protein IJU08_03045 [Bacteroidales bacterium]|nr:hypothetical protein [Bacteroidales bacterium]